MDKFNHTDGQPCEATGKWYLFPQTVQEAKFLVAAANDFHQIKFFTVSHVWQDYGMAAIFCDPQVSQVGQGLVQLNVPKYVW